MKVYLASLLFMGATIVSGPSANAAGSMTIEHIDQASLKQLESDFRKATPLSAQSIASLLNVSWSCEMFGAQSGMQKLNNVSLYRFQPRGTVVLNRGTQPVKTYFVQDGDLKGHSTNLTDSVRLLGSEDIISKLESRPPQKKTIAYARCVGSVDNSSSP